MSPPATLYSCMVPQDASAVYTPAPDPYASEDLTNNGRGAYTSTHATLNAKVTLTSGSNALGTAQVLRLTDNELVCARDFEQARAAAGVPELPVDSAALAAVRIGVDYLVAHGTQDLADPYTGVGVMLAGEYHQGLGCPGFTNAPLSPQLTGVTYAFFAVSEANPTPYVWGADAGVSLVTYP